MSSTTRPVWLIGAAAGCALFGVLFLVAGGAAVYLAWPLTEDDDDFEVAPTPPPASTVPMPSAVLPPDPHAAERMRVPLGPNTPIEGPANAPVTIVEFSDFECPFCGRVQGTLNEVIEARPGQVRLAFKHNPLPFHSNARPAALAALEAYAQGRDPMFFRLHDLLWARQRDLSETTIRDLAIMAGVDHILYDAALAGGTHNAALEADMALAQQLGARGTPNFFINGRQLRGAQPASRFLSIIDEEITYTRSVMAAGVPPALVYQRLMERARTEPPPPTPRPSPPPAARPDTSTRHRVPLDPAPSRGPANALVTIVIFSDFQCPFCSRVRPTLERIVETYPDVRLMFRHNPLSFHRRAAPAAMAAIEVFDQRGSEAFWRYHDRLFDNQRALEDADLIRHLRGTGANAARVRSAITSSRHQPIVDRDQTLARSLGATGTPAFFINGRLLSGAQPFTAFQTVIDEELTAARALVAAGTPRAGVYEALQRSAAP